MGSCDAGRSDLIDGKYGICDLVDVGELRTVFETFAQATGFTISFLDHPGLNVLITTGWRDICTKFHRANPASAALCTKSNRHLLGLLKERDNLVIEICDNGLVNCAIPIIVKGKHIASLATGRFLLEEPDVERFRLQAELYGFDTHEYLEALRNVPVVSEQKVRNVAAFLREMARLVSKLGYSNLLAREESHRLENEVAERKRAEAALRTSEARVGHLNDVLRAIRDVNGLLSREKEPWKLLTAVCNSLVQTRGYIIVWIGQPEKGSKRVLPVAHSGVNSEFLQHSLITWDDSPTGEGPAGTAMRERRPVVFDDIANDPRFILWKERVISYGGASIASVPLIYDGRLFGVLTVKADRPFAFDAEEVDLLSGLATDIARMMQSLEDGTARKQAEDALRESEKELRFLSSKLLSVQEEGRKRIAAELHDSLGSSLTAIKVGIENARIRFAQGEPLSELLDAPIALTQLAINEVRKIMAELRPLILDDFGIIAALNWFFRQYRTTYPGIHVEVEFDIEERDIPEELRIVIFRIAQEAFNNIAKYSGAGYVDFSLVRRDGAVNLIIEDNGDGFDLEAVLSKIGERRGLGLTSMKERAELSGGSFAIRSVPGTGTMLNARWPLSMV